MLDASKAPWKQDGIEIRLDARPATERDYAKNLIEFDEILVIALSPAAEGQEVVFYRPDLLPAGVQAVCKRTEKGHDTKVAIQVDYVNGKQGAPGSAFRLNIAIDDFDRPGSKGAQLWWHPDWRRPVSYSGFGTFLKKED